MARADRNGAAWRRAAARRPSLAPVGADRFRHRFETVAAQLLGELGRYAARQARTVKDQGGIELHQAGAGTDLVIGVGAARDTAATDQRQLAAGDAIHLG